eukprot:6287610-Alexandrium_andersonii.AAC.1
MPVHPRPRVQPLLLAPSALVLGTHPCNPVPFQVSEVRQGCRVQGLLRARAPSRSAEGHQPALE